MTNSEPRGDALPESKTLRERAEKTLETSRDDIAGMSPEDIQRMFHELQVHQIELKLQNEELRDAQLELAHSRDMYSNLYEFAPVGYLTLDSKGSILQANLTFAEMLGVERSGLLGRKLAEFATRGSSDDLHRHLQSVYSTDAKITSELTMNGADGIGRVFQLESRAVSGNQGDCDPLNSPQCRTAIIDVTERNRTVEALRREHELSESLITTAQGIVLLLDMQGKILRFNPYFESLTGWRLEDVKGLEWLETCIPENERSAIGQRFNNAISGMRTVRKVNSILCRDGSIRTIEWYDAILCNDAGEQIGLLATGQDITDRRAMERHLLQIADDEKRRIGHDLHDGLGQELTGLSMMAESLRLDLQDKSLPESKIAEKIAKQVDDSLQELRRLARGMDPVDIDPQGLESELTQLAIHVSSLYGIECTFTCDGRVVLDDSEIATNLFRIAQEAITNAAKHGRADQIEISILQADDKMVLQVSDNGGGIANLEEIQTGVGMRSMRYRASVIGGSMHIEQRKQGGTAVTCTLPLN